MKSNSLPSNVTPVYKKPKADCGMTTETAQPKHDPRPRYHAVARRLSLLSPELVHKIFDDLPIGRILELACLPDAPYIEQCAITHYGISKIFDKDQFKEVQAYFTVYARLCRDRQGRKHSGYPDLNPKSSPILQRDTAYFLAYFKVPTEARGYILSDIKEKISVLLQGYQTYLSVLLRFDDSKIPNRESWKYLLSAEHTQILWESLVAAETALNTIKAEQILRICELLAKYPGMLRKVQNNSQDARPNAEQHHIQILRQTAQKMLKPQMVRQQFIANDLFATHRFPIIPYDRHLRCFLKVIKKYPPGGDKIYSPDIQKDLKTVIDGMAFVYIRDTISAFPKPQLLRTKFTPYCPKGLKAALGQNQPQFVVGVDPPVPRRKRAQEIDEADDWRISDNRDRILPLEEKEFEWLEAFLRCCKYMEAIQDAEWTAGVTIGNFWKKYTSIGLHATNKVNTPVT